jgi:transposase
MQTYGSIIPGGPTLARLLPLQTAEGRKEVLLSDAGRRRLKAIRWYEAHGGNASLTARHYGLSRSTFHVWLKRYKETGARGLEDRSRRPRRLRQPTWGAALEAAVLRLRQENPCWGKDTLTPILRREGVTVSVSMVGRILGRLKRQGRIFSATLDDPCIVTRPGRMRRVSPGSTSLRLQATSCR